MSAPVGIELRHLRAFVTTAEMLHFGRAAAVLHVSQSALSRQVAALERLIGCDLLYRSTHHVELSPAGVVLLQHARGLVRDLDRAVSMTRWADDTLPDRFVRWIRPLVAALDAGVDLDGLRAAYEAMMAAYPVPAEAAVRPVHTDGVPGLVVGPRAGHPTVLYLHGGGYIMGSAYGYRSLTAALGRATGRDLLVPDYRLAPDHPFPAAVEDAVTAWSWQLRHGLDPAEAAVMGDSSGAGLVLSLLITLRRRGLSMPGRAVLLCPWIDPGSDRPVLGTARWLRSLAQHTQVVELDTDDLNPLVHHLDGLPPLLVQVAAGDAVSPEAYALVARVRRDGGQAELQSFDVQTHVFHQFWSVLAQAATALECVGEFVGPALGRLDLPTLARSADPGPRASRPPGR